MEDIHHDSNRKILLVIMNATLAHWGAPLIKTPFNINYLLLYEHLDVCYHKDCKYFMCSILKPYLYHLNNCNDILCPFCGVYNNFVRKNMIETYNFQRPSNLNFNKNLHNKKC
jgi:hypothetical protein